jgi:dipeptidyl aminopeptidase/acylaminoacyl peptidase
MRAPFGLVGLVVVTGLATFANADTPSPFSYAHAGAGSNVDPATDPFAYPHGLPTAQAYSGLGAESVTPEVIAKYAPPPLDPDVSRKVQAMLDVRGLDGGQVSAKGDRMFFTWSITGTAQVWRQDGAMKYPIQLTSGEDNTFLAGVAPDDTFVVVSRDIGGSENPGLYVIAPTGGPLQVIQHVPHVQTRLAVISDDSKSIYYSANDRDPASYAFYRYDVATKQKELVFDKPGVWRLVDHQGTTWLLAKELGNTHVEIWTYDLATQELRVRLGANESEDYEARFGPRAGQLIVLTNKPSEFARLYSFEYKSGESPARSSAEGGAKVNEVLTPITGELAHDIEEMAIDRTRTRLYYAVNDDGYRHLHVIDAKTFKPIALPKLPVADSTALASMSVTGRFVELGVSGPTKLPATYVYDWQTAKLTEWRPPAAPEIDLGGFAKATLESYPARDGVRIPMFVRRPAACANAAKPCPVVVSFHGGPEAQARPIFDPRAQLFVDAGFIYVQPNVRGSSGYGKAWLHADDGPKRLDVITDIEDAAKYIRSAWAKNGVAPKIGVFGGSYGGYSVLMAMTLFAGAYDAGVEQVGIANFETFLANTAPYRRIERISEYGDPVKDKVALEKLSPINYIDRVKAPLLIFQGVNDPRVPVGEALQIHGALEAHKIANRLILFPDEGHGASKRSNIVLTLGHTLTFFAQQLK